MAYKIETPAEVLAWAQQNNWLLIWSLDDYGRCAFLSTAGQIVEFTFDRNRVNVQSLLSYTCK
jgi:hypothetical protein